MLLSIDFVALPGSGLECMPYSVHRFVVKRLLREASQPQSNVAAFEEDVNAHREAAKLATEFNTVLAGTPHAAQLSYGPVYIIEVPCMVHTLQGRLCWRHECTWRILSDECSSSLMHPD